MKGITPVIAIILLLLITISMVGFAFVWFSRVAQTAGSEIESQTQQELQNRGKRVSIDNVDAGNQAVTIRNIGTQTITRSEISVFEGGTIQTCGWTPDQDLTAGAVATCDYGAGTCSSGTTVRVAAPGNVDEVNC